MSVIMKCDCCGKMQKNDNDFFHEVNFIDRRVEHERGEITGMDICTACLKEVIKFSSKMREDGV